MTMSRPIAVRRAAFGLCIFCLSLAAAAMLAAASPRKEAAELLELAEREWRAGETNQARRALKTLLEHNPGNRDARILLAGIETTLGHPQAAVTTISPLLEEGVPERRVMLVAIRALHDAGHIVETESLSRLILARAPNCKEGRQWLLRALYLQGRWNECARLALDFLGDQPDNCQLWRLRAQSLLAGERIREAMLALDAARRLGLADAAMMLTLADLLVSRERPEEAVPLYEQLLEMEGMTAAIAGGWSRSIARLIETGGLAHDEPLVSRMEKLSGEWPEDTKTDILRLRAVRENAAGELAAATAAWQELLSINPLDGPALLALADLKQRRGNKERALLLYKRAARIDGFQAPALLSAGLLAAAMGRHGEAADLVEQAAMHDHRPALINYVRQLRRLAGDNL